MEEALSPQESQTIDLISNDSQREIELTLTVGHVKLITALIEQNIQPKGYEMIKLVYELFERLQIPDLPSEDTPAVTNQEEAFE